MLFHMYIQKQNNCVAENFFYVKFTRIFIILKNFR